MPTELAGGKQPGGQARRNEPKLIVHPDRIGGTRARKDTNNNKKHEMVTAVPTSQNQKQKIPLRFSKYYSAARERSRTLSR